METPRKPRSKHFAQLFYTFSYPMRNYGAEALHHVAPKYGRRNAVCGRAAQALAKASHEYKGS